MRPRHTLRGALTEAARDFAALAALTLLCANVLVWSLAFGG